MSRYTTQDLIEQNMLYALGLLDEPERTAYESAIADAPDAVRALVFNEARRMSDLGDLLPDDQPSPELRHLVLAAVRAAMQEAQPDRRVAHTAVAGRITPDQAAPRRHAQPSLPRGTRVHPVWRAATIGLAAATVALTIVTVNIKGTYNQLDSDLLIAQIYDKVGASYVESTLFDPNTARISFTAAAPSDAQPNARPLAAVWHNPDWDAARLFVKNLKPTTPDKPYRLVVLDDQGNVVREVTEFNATGELQNFTVTINPATEARLAIYQAPQDGVTAEPVLSSSI